MKIKFISLLIIPILFQHISFAQQINAHKIDSFLTYIEQQNRDIGSVSIFQNGKEIYNRHFGQFDSTTFNKNTKYYIGSISKLFTATLIFKLIEQGKLDLNDKLSNFFPKIPNAKKITIKNLLEHSSGLGDYVAKEENLYWLRKKRTEPEILNLIKKQGTLFQPGDSVAYSNSGYYLLEKIVENKFNNKYNKIIKKQITNPLHLTNIKSVLDHPTNVFHSYKYRNENWKKIQEFDFTNVVGVGDLVATPRALNQFIIALFHNKIISKESIEKMRPKKGKLFGKGMMLIPFYQHLSYGHGGDTFGSHSVVAYNPENHLAIAYIINGERYPINNLAIGMLSIIYNKDFKFPIFTNIKLKPERLDQYIGTYSSPKLPIKINIKRKGDELFGQGTGQPSFPLTPLDSNTFRFMKAGVKIIFHTKTHSMTFKQGNITAEMKKDKNSSDLR